MFYCFKVYIGHTWNCIRIDHVKIIIKEIVKWLDESCAVRTYLMKNWCKIKNYNFAFAPDEFVFQTILFNNVRIREINCYFNTAYVIPDENKKSRHPKCVNYDELKLKVEEVCNNRMYICFTVRKFDTTICIQKLIQLLPKN